MSTSKTKAKLTDKGQADYDKRVAAQTGDQPKVERKRLTPAERIARAEAELKAAREKAEAEVRAKVNKLEEQLVKATAKRDEAQAKVDAINAELRELGVNVDETDSPVELPA